MGQTLSSPPIGPAPTVVASRDSLLAVVVGFAVIGALYVARDVLIPITLAILLAFVLSPIVTVLRRLRMPRVIAVVLAAVFAIGVIASVASVIGVQIATLAADFPRYESTVQQKVDTVRGLVLGRLSALSERITQPVLHGNPVRESDAGALPNGPETRAAPVELLQPHIAPLEIVRHMAPVLDKLELLVIVLVVSIFVLLQAEDLRDRFTLLLDPRDPGRTAQAMGDAAHRLSRFFLSQLMVNCSVGAIIAAGLFLIGVPSPVLWGILAGLLRFVPYIGTAIATMLAVFVAAAVSPGWSMALQTAALFAIVESLVGQFIEPAIYGHNTGISPLGVVIAAILWTWLWGSIGLVISTPLSICVLVLSRHVPRLAFLDILFGDRTQAACRKAIAQPAEN